MPDAITLTPEEANLLEALGKKLKAQQTTYASYNLYYEQGGPLPDAIDKVRENYRALIRKAKANWSGVVVDVVAERLEVIGIRLGADVDANLAIWNAVWEGNRLNATERGLYTDALIGGVSYVLTDPTLTVPSTGAPRVTPESPLEMAALTDSYGDPYAALKLWTDEATQKYRANLYLPGVTYRMQSATKATSTADFGRTPRTDAATMLSSNGLFVATDVTFEGWEKFEPRSGPEVEDEPVAWDVETGVDLVTVSPFLNDPKLLSGGRSELVDVTPTQDRINQTLLDRLIAQQFDSFRQKYVIGLDLDTDPETGKPVEPFESAADRIMYFRDPDVKTGTWEAGDITGLLSAIEADVMELAAISRTPPHVLIASMSILPGAESQRASDAGLYSKLGAKQNVWGEAWERTFSHVSAVGDGSLEVPVGARVRWKDPAAVTITEAADAAVKLGAVLPLEAVLEAVGTDPERVAAWLAQQGKVALPESTGPDSNGTQPVPEAVPASTPE